MTAIAKEGYEFIGWSDRVENASRQETDVKRDAKYIAYFRQPERTFTYVYNGATSNTSKQSVALSFDDIHATSFTVPSKEGYVFGGWYLEPELTTKAVDNYGNLMLGYGIFDSDITSNHLYARWVIPSDDITYRILMVFVDEIHATLPSSEGIDIDVDFKMSAFEREVCKLLSYEISKHLNKLFENRVKFEIDSYFTTKAISTEDFNSGTNSKLTYYIMADKITDINHMLKDYRSVMTTFSMEDYHNILHTEAGLAHRKYASLHLESMFYLFYVYNNPIDELLDANHSHWSYIMDLYLHEFTHTAEDYYSYPNEEILEYHEALGFAGKFEVPFLKITELYLLNRLEIDGKLVGIPFSYWQGDFDIAVYYGIDRSNVHAIEGNEGLIVTGGESYIWGTTQVIKFGSDTKEVTAIPPKGYRFVKWSDGHTSPTRQDKNIVEPVGFTAIFEEIE